MRIARFLDQDNHVRYGVEQPDHTANLLAQSPLEGDIATTGKIVDIRRRLAPVTPVNIFCVGLNYRAHAEETNAELPEHPTIFMKPTTAANDPESAIVIPACCTRGDEVDYECELAVVIGKAGRNIAEADSLSHVWGYAIGNDLTRRDLQLAARDKGRPWDFGKAFDRSAVVGPVHPAEKVGHPDKGSIKLTVNGEVKQDADLSELIWSVPEVVSILSHSIALQPGDLIMTGTPAGVGPLAVGDKCTVAIEGLGEITTTIGPRA